MTSTLNKKGSNRVVEIAVYFRANGGSSRGVAVGGARFPIAGSLLGAYHDSGHYAVFVRWGAQRFPPAVRWNRPGSGSRCNCGELLRLERACFCPMCLHPRDRCALLPVPIEARIDLPELLWAIVLLIPA